jgi:hypothetical protein
MKMLKDKIIMIESEINKINVVLSEFRKDIRQ